VTQIKLEIPDEDIDFLFQLFDLFCEDREHFDPEAWLTAVMKKQMKKAIQDLREGIKGRLRDGLVDQSHLSGVSGDLWLVKEVR